MNVPIDRLYHYINNIAQEIYGDRVIIYRFFPHGSKNINDLINLNDYGHQSIGPNEWLKKAVSPALWCNDQEPLDYEFYQTNILERTGGWTELIKSAGCYTPPKNLDHSKNIFEKNLLLHSEQRSANLEKYQNDNELIPVYYWSHAIIARDWFRYAEHEKFERNVKKKFLIYNRAWSGTREYRLYFANLLIRLGLERDCQMNISPIEPELGIHYDLHKFANPEWRPTNVLENYFPVGRAHSSYSADFDTYDYMSTDIEVVLETLFDDSRLHLTEKSLRPIACGQPFMLAGTHGSLEYLRRYGFKTFGNIWNEEYDTIEDPVLRLCVLTDEMRKIANWTVEERARNLALAQEIADYNRKHFFSKEFFNIVVDELKENLRSAFTELKQLDDHTAWISRWEKLLSYPELIAFLETNQDTKAPTKEQVESVLAKVKALHTI